VIVQPLDHPPDDAAALDHLAHEDGAGVAGQTLGSGRASTNRLALKLLAKSGSDSPMAWRGSWWRLGSAACFYCEIRATPVVPDGLHE
jgi:hypothetical protein